MRGGCRVQARGKGRIIVTVVKLKPRPINSPVVGPASTRRRNDRVSPLWYTAVSCPWKSMEINLKVCLSYRQIAPRFEARRENGRLLCDRLRKKVEELRRCEFSRSFADSRDKTRVETVLSPLICINPTGSIPLVLVGGWNWFDSILILKQFRGDVISSSNLLS